MISQSTTWQLHTSQCLKTWTRDEAHLKQENDQLWKKLDYICKLLKMSIKLLLKVQFVSKRFQKSVLEYKNNQKIINDQFLKETQI